MENEYLWLACSYVCIGHKNSVSKALFSLLVCMYCLPRQAHPPKVKYSLSAVYEQAIRIFHFVRVCLSWKTITYIQAERTKPWTQNISGQYRHTYEQRERERETDGFHVF